MAVPPQGSLLILPRAPIITTDAPAPIRKFLMYLNAGDLTKLIVILLKV
jgi:hypothetical protein